MMTDLDFDGLLESTLAGRGPQVAPASLGDDVMQAVGGVAQRRPRLRVLDVRAWPAPRRSLADPAMVRAMRIAIVAVLAMIAIATSAVVGVRLLQREDARHLVFGSRDGGLYLADLDGSEPRRIAADGRYVEPRFSPDGRWIAVDYLPVVNLLPLRGSTIDRRLVILGVDGERVLDLPSMNPVSAYAWGATGGAEGWLAAALDESIVVVDPATGARLTIDTAGSGVTALAWSPEVPVLWYVAGGSGSGVFGRGIDDAVVHVVGIHAVDGALQRVGERTFRVRLDPARRYRALERMAVSPDGQTLAFRARTEGWLRSDVALVHVGGSVPTSYVNPAPPGEPWISAWSGIRWTPDGQGVVVEVGDLVGAETSIVRPAILPIDGGAPRPIEAGPITVDSWGGAVSSDGPVLPTDTTILVGGAREWIDVPGGQLSVYDLWLADADGEASRLVATGTFGGDLR